MKHFKIGSGEKITAKSMEKYNFISFNPEKIITE